MPGQVTSDRADAGSGEPGSSPSQHRTRAEDLAGCVAIVTGGSAGIGRSTCLALARAGAAVVVVARGRPRLDATIEEIRSIISNISPGTKDLGRRHSELGPQNVAREPLALSLDVTREEDMRTMAERVMERFGRVDLLVHAAGILRRSDAPLRMIAQMPTADFQTVIDINLTGTFLANRAVLPMMIRQRSGDIINLASKSGRKGLAFDGPYCASKFGVIGLSQSLADEVKRYGVRVQTVLPGAFESDVWSQAKLPGPRNLPPADRVAEQIVFMAALPRQARLADPVCEPLWTEAETGWRATRQPGAEVMKRRSPKTNQSAPRSGTAVAGQKAHPIKEHTTMSQAAQGHGPLKEQVLIVTGGAGGIGRAVCLAAAEADASVVVVDVNADAVDQVRAELEGIGSGVGSADRSDRHMGLVVDVRDEQQVKHMAQSVRERYGRIDGLVCSAGVLRKSGTPPKPLVDVDMEEWQQVLSINLTGVFLANRAVLPTMIEQRRGTIVNVSSISGLEGRAHDGPYCASKFGVVGLSQAAADEVRRYGVKVQAIMPHAVDTPMWEQNHPVPKPGDALPPERVADVILFMLTQPADTVLTGAVIAPLGARVRKTQSRGAVVG